MLRSLKDLFDAVLPPPVAHAPADRERRLQLATAVLLVEVMRADPAIVDEERRTVVAALRQQFGLADDEVEHLLASAMDASRDATDYYTFTSRINESFDMPQKLWMVEQMWRVAYADGRLDAHENHVMRKIADLLYIPQGPYVNAKMRAREAMGHAGLEPDPDLA